MESAPSERRKTFAEAVEEDRRFLVAFGTQKTAQWSSILGPFVYGMYHHMIGTQLTAPRLLRAAGFTTSFATPAGFIIMFWRMSGEPSWWVRDAAQRIRSNDILRRVDRGSLVGAGFGGVLAATMTRLHAGTPFPRIAGGASFGLIGGAFAALAWEGSTHAWGVWNTPRSV